MKAVFADTLFWVARVRPRDQWRAAARRAYEHVSDALLVTTDEILTEFLAAIARGGPLLRRKALETLQLLMHDPHVRVIPQSRDSFLRALERYRFRLDKASSLTDCAAMNAMDAEGIREVLPNDHHFEQEGYVILITR